MKAIYKYFLFHLKIITIRKIKIATFDSLTKYNELMINDLEAKITNLFKVLHIRLGKYCSIRFKFYSHSDNDFISNSGRIWCLLFDNDVALIASTIFYLGITSALPRSILNILMKGKEKLYFLQA